MSHIEIGLLNAVVRKMVGCGIVYVNVTASRQTAIYTDEGRALTEVFSEGHLCGQVQSRDRDATCSHCLHLDSTALTLVSRPLDFPREGVL